MRVTTVMATALVALSGAALAQVARTPAEPKSEPFANMEPASNAATASATAGNGVMANDVPPASPDTKTESAAPKR